MNRAPRFNPVLDDSQAKTQEPQNIKNSSVDSKSEDSHFIDFMQVLLEELANARSDLEETFFSTVKEHMLLMVNELTTNPPVSYKQTIPLLLPLLMDQHERLRGIIKEEIDHKKAFDDKLNVQLVYLVSQEYENTIKQEVDIHMSKRSYIRQIYDEKIENIRRAAKVELQACLLKQESVFRETWKIAFREHEEDMVELIRRHEAKVEEVNKKYEQQIRNYQDEIAKHRFQQQLLLVEIQDLKSFREKLAQQELEHNETLAIREREKQDLRNTISAHEFELRREKDRADNEVLLRNSLKMQLEKDAKAFKGQLLKLQEKAKEKEERALRLGEALKLGLSQMQQLESELRRLGVDPRSIVPHPVQFPGTRKAPDPAGADAAMSDVPSTPPDASSSSAPSDALPPSSASLSDAHASAPAPSSSSLPPISMAARGSSSLQPHDPFPRDPMQAPAPLAPLALPPAFLDYTPSPRAQRFHMPRPPPPPVALDVPPPDAPALNAAYGVPELLPHTPHTPHTPRTPLGPIQRGAPSTPRAKERLPGYTRKPPYNSKFSAPYPAE